MRPFYLCIVAPMNYAKYVEDKGYNAGYSFHGRMMGLLQMDGVMATVKYFKENK